MDEMDRFELDAATEDGREQAEHPFVQHDGRAVEGICERQREVDPGAERQKVHATGVR